MPIKRTITTTTTTETLPPVVTYETRSRRSLDFGTDDVISRGTLSRRQDQKIKDDITNKLYRLEMDQIKPGQDVQLRTAIFRSSRPVSQKRHLTPEPITRVLHQVVTPTTRRYSIVGDLGYRPIGGDVIVEKVEPLKVTVSRPITEYYTSYDWHKAHQPDTEFSSLRKEEANGPRYEQATVYRALSTPPSLSEPLVTRHSYASVSHPTQNGVKQALNDSKRHLSDFEKLMKKTFGPGGVNKTSTPLYTSPPYYYPNYYTTPDYYRNYYTATAPDYYRHYYTTTTPRYYYSTLPVGGAYEKGVVSTLDTLPDYYTHRYNPTKGLNYDYILYSPPTRVTGPPSLNYYAYYDQPLHSSRYTPSTGTYYSLIR